MTAGGSLVAVTGASGHLGANLVPALLEAGYRVRAVRHRRPIPATVVAHNALGVSEADVLNLASIEAVFRGARAVFHLAGRISIAGDPDGRVHAINVEGARNVAEACLAAGVQRLVHCSSVHAFNHGGRPAGPVDETFELLTEQAEGSAYDHAKAAGQRAVAEVARRGLEVVYVHPSAVIGPADHGPSRMGRVFLDLRDGGVPALVAGAYDFVDARDVAAGMCGAMERGQPGERYLLGGHFVSLAELARIAASITGTLAPRWQVPVGLAALAAPAAETWAQWRRREPLFTREALAVLRHARPVNSEKARRELGYTVRPLADSVRDLYADFATRGV